MITVALLLALQADGAAAADDVHFPPSAEDDMATMRREPVAQHWRDCVQLGAEAMSHGPDAADLVAAAAVTLCEDDARKAALAYLDRFPQDTIRQFLARERKELIALGVAAAVRKRSLRILPEAK